MKIELTVNGQAQSVHCEERTLLADLLRESLGLTGTHIGCDTSQCGCCTIHLDGQAVKSCTLLAAQADGCDIVTIEGLAKGERLHAVQQRDAGLRHLQRAHALPPLHVSAPAALLHAGRRPASDPA